MPAGPDCSTPNKLPHSKKRKLTHFQKIKLVDTVWCTVLSTNFRGLCTYEETTIDETWGGNANQNVTEPF